MLSRKEVQHVALLSRIGTSEDEEKKLEADLGSILDFFQELEGYPLLEEGETGRRVVGRGRADRARSPLEPTGEAIKKNFPVTHHNYLKVRSVF